MSPSDTSQVKSQTLPQKHKGKKLIKIQEYINNNDKVSNYTVKPVLKGQIFEQ